MNQHGADGSFDVFVIGGGVNGCAIARDAVGRGLSVALAEQGDLAQGTSSASTKLFHGGLRYLEYFEFRLVREALAERETLLAAMPHICRPMRFVLPLSPEMRFPGGTPTSTLMGLLMPWLKGRRPNWLIRLGLLMYDTLGGRDVLPATRSLDLRRDPAGAALQPRFEAAYEYSDCWVDDARLVALMARDAASRGARVMTRTRVISARRSGDLWHIVTQSGGRQENWTARALVNAGGPWVSKVIAEVTDLQTRESVRLVRGSHLVVRRLFDHDRAYFFQGADGRIVFAIPYESDFTLIGTTDEDHQGPPGNVSMSEGERDYLLSFVSEYFRAPVTVADIVWAYSGVRPLHSDGSGSASAATRDYVLSLDEAGPVLLSVFGGKLTTHRRLAEAAMEKLAPHFPGLPPAWTARVALPGGDFALADLEKLVADLRVDYPFLTSPWAWRLARAYGTEARAILGSARSVKDLGIDFGATLTSAEVDWMITREFAGTADDVLWRRSKLGLRLDTEQVKQVDDYVKARVPA